MAKTNSQKKPNASLGPRNADSLRQDLHPDLKADFILANGSMCSNQSTLTMPPHH
jgi:hypothetical protein